MVTRLDHIATRGLGCIRMDSLDVGVEGALLAWIRAR